MTAKEYRAILGRLPIENPAPEDMGLVCPHLTQEQAVAAFNNEPGYVACPPLRVRGGFQIVSYSKGLAETEEVAAYRDVGVEATTEQGLRRVRPSRPCWSYAGRTRQSYADGRSHGDIFCEYQYMSEAMKFAEDNWGDELALDTWRSVIEFFVQDPTDLYEEGFSKGCPKTKAVVRVCLNREWGELINDHTKPESVLIDEALVEITLDAVVWHELKGGRGGYGEFNCAYCGRGLHLSGCSGCGHRFKDDCFRSGWDTPLPRKIVEFLQADGHVFKKDPAIAWRREAERHQRIL